MSEAIRLFMGAAANGEDLESQVVAEYSARRHCSMPLEITWMQQSAKGPYSGWKCGSGRTPFTHFRWSLPAMCGYEGKAIYTDVDFIFRADLAELWQQDVPGVFLAKVGKKGLGKTCAMLFDCGHAKGHVPTLDVLRRMPDPQGTLMQYFKQRPALSASFEGDWNAIDLKGYADIADPRIKAIHYSRIEMQPSFPYAQKRLASEGKAHWYTGPTGPHERPELIALFDQLYQEALASGSTLDQYRGAGFAGATRKNFTYTHSRVGLVSSLLFDLKPVDLISPKYCDLQRELHARPNGYGGKGNKWAQAVRDLIAQYDAHSVLDYGCGEGSLKTALSDVIAAGVRVDEYDPAVIGKETWPRFADLVICTDVLEHIEPDKLSTVLAHLKVLARKAVFVVIATRPSNKTMADGRNAHLILEPNAWWATRMLETGFTVLPTAPTSPLTKPSREWVAVLEP